MLIKRRMLKIGARFRATSSEASPAVQCNGGNILAPREQRSLHTRSTLFSPGPMQGLLKPKRAIMGHRSDKLSVAILRWRVIIPCFLLSLVYLCLRFTTDYDASSKSFDLYQLSLASNCTPSSTVQTQTLKEWQDSAVLADREAEKLDDPYYGVPRRFVPMGTATFLFVHFSTHRVAPNAFAVVGLGAKSAFLHSNPRFVCAWNQSSSSSLDWKSWRSSECNGTYFQPNSEHVSYGKEYTGTVVYCTFDGPVGDDALGGKLQVRVTHGTRDKSGLEDVTFIAKHESPGEFKPSNFQKPPQLDHVYCGGPLHSTLNPQRVREWVAYHAWFFGAKTHFFLYDAGGISDAVRAILQPWVKLGTVTVMNVRQEARYNSHYHNQYVILNDCLARSKALGTWAWFFDMDEFIWRPEGTELNDVVQRIEEETKSWLKRLQRVSLEQRPVSVHHCRRDAHAESDWAISKLVYRRTQITEKFGFPDRKNFVRADSALATGPHEPVAMSMPPGANSTNQVTAWDKTHLFYYHYRGVYSQQEKDLCRELLDTNVNATQFHSVAHQFDDSVKRVVDQVKAFELRMIGPHS